MKEFQGVLTLICGGAAQTCHDDRVVELKESLGIEEVDGEGQGRKSKGRRESSSQRERAMSMTVDDCEWTQNLRPGGVRCHHQVWNSALYVQTQTHDDHAIVEVNVVIGGPVVHCELLVVRVVPVVVFGDAVVRRTLVLIAFIVAFVFVVAILHRILLYWRYTVYTPPSVTVNCFWLLPNFEL